MVFNVELSTTVETLKKALGQREGLKVDEIKLLWAGKELKNHLTMLEYGIQKNSTLFLVLQLDGGGRKKRIKLVRVLEDGTTVTRQLTDVKLSPEPCMITFEAEPEDPRAETPCGHAITPGALTALVRSLVDKGSYQVTCPAMLRGRGPTAKPEPCGAEWKYPWIRKVGLLQPEECRDFERRLSLNAANNLRGFYAVTCAKCKELIVRGNDTLHRVECPYPNCLFVFCDLCSRQWTTASDAKHCGNAVCESTTAEFNRILAQCPTITIDFGAKIEGVPKYRVCPQADCRFPLYEHGGHCKNFRCVKCDRKFCFSCLTMTAKGDPCSLGKRCTVSPRQQV